MSSYYDEPSDSSGLLSNPRTVTIIIAVITAIVAIVGCAALYFFVNGNRGGAADQGTQVIAFTSQPSLTPSLTPIIIPTETPAPTEETGTGGGGEEPTPDLTATFAALPAGRTANLVELRGKVELKANADSGFETVLGNVAVPEGATLLTSEDSHARLTTTEGSIIRVSSQTQFTLTDLSGTTGNPVTSLSLDFGKVWTIVGGPLGTGKFEVVTPIGTAAIIGSWMGVEHNSNEQIDIVTCLEGKCRYSNSQGVQEMETGEMLIVTAGQLLPNPIKMDQAQLADWAVTKVPEVITLTPTATTTGTATQTRTPTNTRTPVNTPNVQQTSDKSGTSTSIAATATKDFANQNGTATNVAATNTALAGANSLTQAANSQNLTATKNASNLTATVFFFNATATAFYQSTQNSFTSTSFAFTATSFAATSNYQATSSLLTGTAQGATATANSANVTSTFIAGSTNTQIARLTGTATALTATQAAKPIINFDPSSYATAVPESAGQVSLTIRIANPVPGNVLMTANLQSASVDGNPAATGGGSLPVSPFACNGSTVDFVNTAINFFIPANSTTATILIPVNDDGCSELNETFQVTLACQGACSSYNNAELGPNTTSTVTIVNVSAPTVSFSSGSPSANEGDSGSTDASVTVTLSRAYASVSGNSNTVGVAYSTFGGTATGAGSCGGYPTDYNTNLTDDDGGVSGALSFPPGVTSRTITIPVCGDTVSEGNETIFLQLTSPTSNTSLGTGTATFTIIDNDPLPNLTVSMVTASSVAEPALATDSLNATFRITISGTPGRDVTVQYATQAGTATSGVDYLSSSGTVTFLKDTVTLTQDINVTIKGDALDEEDETFSFVLSSPTNGTLGATSSVVQTIQDDAADLAPNVFLSNTPANVSESGGGSSALDCNNNPSPSGQVYVNVNLDFPSGKVVFVNYATSNGTATVPSDYYTTSGTLQFNPGEQCKSFLITIVNDTVAEPTESIVLTLSGALNANISGTNPRNLFILDND
jgi:hypothetical protein